MRTFGANALGWRKPLTVHRDLTNGHDDLNIFYPIEDAKCKGVFMSIDLYAKAIHLLEKIANSIHEREQKKTNLLCFSSCEVIVVEEWLKDFVHCVGTNKPANGT